MLVLHIWREHRGENWSMNNSRNHKAIKASPPSPHREQVWEILQEIYRSAAAIQGPTWRSFKVNVLNQVCHLGLLLCLSSRTMYIFIFTFSWIVFHWGIHRLFSFFLPPKYSHTHTHKNQQEYRLFAVWEWVLLSFMYWISEAMWWSLLTMKE